MLNNMKPTKVYNQNLNNMRSKQPQIFILKEEYNKPFSQQWQFNLSKILQNEEHFR